MYLKYLRKIPLVLTLLSLFLLTGCDMALMDPKGSIGLEQRSIILTATALMLIVVLPVIIMTIFFAWKYRASNKQALYRPTWDYSPKLEIVIWAIPILIVAALAYITWRSSHELDPRKAIVAQHPQINIQVVALDWKWLFIYPDYAIATINEITLPVDTPVQFKITSETVMNSFFIPRLGSQLYAMAGMENTLHLIANEQGVYQGQSSNFSGQGFSGMKFAVNVTSEQGFNDWLTKVKQSNQQLDNKQYNQLIKPSENNPVHYFSTVTPGLYHAILDKFIHGHAMSGEE